MTDNVPLAGGSLPPAYVGRSEPYSCQSAERTLALLAKQQQQTAQKGIPSYPRVQNLGT